MKASARILITATLAALTTLGLAATATASVPTPPGGQQHPTTAEPGTGPQPGHGAQLHHEAHDPAPATASQPPTDHTTSADSAFAPWIAVLARAAASATSSRLDRSRLRVEGAAAPHLAAPSARPVEILSMRRSAHYLKRRPQRMSEANEPAEAMGEGLRGDAPTPASLRAWDQRMDCRGGLRLAVSQAA